MILRIWHTFKIRNIIMLFSLRLNNYKISVFVRLQIGKFRSKYFMRESEISFVHRPLQQKDIRNIYHPYPLTTNAKLIFGIFNAFPYIVLRLDVDHASFLRPTSSQRLRCFASISAKKKALNALKLEHYLKTTGRLVMTSSNT